MTVELRVARAADAEECGRICYEAFKNIAHRYNFPSDFPDPETAIGLMRSMLANQQVYGVAAERDGQIVGSNFLWETAVVAGVGPITVDPAVQNGSLGRMLMQRVLERAKEQRCAGVRLVQAAYHGRSLGLYTKLGFDVREPLSLLQGPTIRVAVDGYSVRPATLEDIDSCNRLSLAVHGFARAGDLLAATQQGTASVVEHDGRITGYATAIGFFGHAIGESNEDLRALIGAAPTYEGPGFLLPTRNAELLRWCLDRGLRVVQPMTLMSMGLYSEPNGRFLPSILY